MHMNNAHPVHKRMVTAMLKKLDAATQ